MLFCCSVVMLLCCSVVMLLCCYVVLLLCCSVVLLLCRLKPPPEEVVDIAAFSLQCKNNISLEVCTWLCLLYDWAIGIQYAAGSRITAGTQDDVDL